MFTFVIGLVVVGVALVLAIRVALAEEPTADKPATSRAERGRGRPASTQLRNRKSVAVIERDDPAIADAVSPWRRIRSGVLLLLLVTTLGALAALVVLVAGTVVLTGLRNAVQ